MAAFQHMARFSKFTSPITAYGFFSRRMSRFVKPDGDGGVLVDRRALILQLEAEGIPRTLSKKYADIVASTLEESHRNGLNIVKQEDLLCQVKNHRNNIINECHNLRNGLKITSVEMRNAAAAEPTSDETDLEMKKPRPSFEEAAPRAFRRTLGFVSLYVVSFAGLIGVVRTRKNHGV
ncbi:hypothetical protein ABFS82_02G073700 [Erythranthe guttata]|uniref:Uncharacterized protein n=1 Tax=Erythranthe guttata TaxID=4155 RepID=A0A022QJ13_ERYGU|nr:PREDICTED: uncharacterized protein LOC105970079 [Erythranthe guttata]EYU26475.1 hypothetical protein MIMGU_mgv1a014815mg [Erythranthe guttata]|eukprot:XP_012850317.1 PREDICTED: uncharacterized protein LOC105970079 [Erythranthe guttata]